MKKLFKILRVFGRRKMKEILAFIEIILGFSLFIFILILIFTLIGWIHSLISIPSFSNMLRKGQTFNPNYGIFENFPHFLHVGLIDIVIFIILLGILYVIVMIPIGLFKWLRSNWMESVKEVEIELHKSKKTESYKDIKQDALNHYDRMIDWASKQDPDEFPKYAKMIKEIGEDWYLQYCSFCRNFYKEYYGLGNNCEDCPLNGCNGCCNGLWDNMNISETWSEWIVNARRVRKYIKDNEEIYMKKLIKNSIIILLSILIIGCTLSPQNYIIKNVHIIYQVYKQDRI